MTTSKKENKYVCEWVEGGITRLELGITHKFCAEVCPIKECKYWRINGGAPYCGECGEVLRPVWDEEIFCYKCGGDLLICQTCRAFWCDGCTDLWYWEGPCKSKIEALLRAG